MGKLSELKVSGAGMGVNMIDNQEEEAQRPVSTGQSRHHEQDASGVLNDFNERAFDLIPLETYFSDDAESGPSHCGGDGDCNSDRDVDECVEGDSFPTAGCIIRMDCMLHEKWRAHFGYEDANGDMAMGDAPTFEQAFSPFASELDWRVASWAVQEGIGQKTLDWLFSIPGVVEHLGLSYHNARKLHQILDDIPPHAEWQT
ncbi:hypothetical protein SCLCIDRAFT_31363 [Scleroderma citrinum Foug A]|uniref:Uncharacterized protein n=1 Tax=Scleroderma citrinum Foug A TaxID=1036808 RepID=A0A0C3DDI7_9AGAM|nr:hypothetical protein SCLCIDRAFT_31363 [Scleroderma citrinum Foug A]